MIASRTSVDRIRAAYDRHAALYAPSVVTEAAQLLDDLLQTAAKHGHDRDVEGLSWLTVAAAEATSRKYGRPRTERNSTEVYTLHAALSAALDEQGLTRAGSWVRMGVAVRPRDDGPRWGLGGTTGLAVALYTDSGWELMVNSPQTRAFSIHAPTTEAGATEVAQIVRDILTGDTPDPFRPAHR
ncbi:hypothetical protein AB0912_15570 [Streptomyces sp. NPDC007084]|uniref:hypothetical protein n=1 Tax=Streptomyces sp. NPDC007084 TaxID=3154313 RepID=UPI0034567A85